MQGTCCEITHHVNWAREVGRVLGDSALREQDAVGDGLLRSIRALESGVGEIWSVEEVELIGVGLEDVSVQEACE